MRVLIAWELGANYGHCHGGTGTVTKALLSGVPSMLIPIAVDQYLQSKHLVEMGSGLIIEPGAEAEGSAASLNALINNEKYAANAKMFADRYLSFDSTSVIEQAVTATMSAAGGRARLH